MKKNDWILAAVILVASIFFIGYSFIRGEKEAGSLVVTVDGETYGTYSLEENQRIEINDTNVFMIEAGKVNMEFATCPDQYCVDHNVISKNGESIICLPNKVILEIKSSDVADLDAVVN